MYAFPNKQAETWQCVMFLVVTTEVHVKRASFFHFPTIKEQNNITDFSNKMK